jgi:hypothetical protein
MVFFYSPFFSFADQTTYTTAYIPYPLESLDHSARAEALGSAFTSVEGDSACLFYNPAGLAGVLNPEISVIHQSWLANLSQENLSGALPITKAGTLAFGANYLSYGTLQGYDANGFATAPYQPYRATLVLGWGGYLLPALAVGFSARGLSQSLATGVDTIASAVAAGFLWHAYSRLNLGGFYTFLYSDTAADLGQLKWGASYRLPLFGKDPILLSADFSMPPQGVYQIQCGAEQSFFNILVFRLGNQWDLKDNEIEGFRGFTLGLGIHWEGLDLDASFVPDGELGASQMLGLSYCFPSEKPKPSNPAAVSFIPPSQITAADKAVDVKVQFSKAAEPQAPAISPETQKALDEAGKQVQANPKDVLAWSRLGTFYWQAKEPEYAVQCFEEVLQLEPNNSGLKAWLDEYHKSHSPASKPGE